MTNTKRSDEVYLEEIENLSKKISDLINIGKYENIRRTSPMECRQFKT